MDTILTYFSNLSPQEVFYTLIKLLLVTLGISASIYIRKIWNDQQYFKRRGIPGPKFSPIVGNSISIRADHDESKKIEEWTKIYGTNYGYYEGHMPVLITSDLEIIQEVYIKQFNHFGVRCKIPFATPENDKHKSVFDTNSPGRWKRMRLIMNPTFSSAKIREMGPLIGKCIDRLIEQFDNKSEQEISINKYMKQFTMDTIWNCAFGLDLDLQNNPENPYLVNCNRLFKEFENFSFLVFLSFIFEELEMFLYPIYRLVSYLTLKLTGSEIDPNSWLKHQVGQLIDLRLEQKIERNDYMQLLLNVMTDKVLTIHDSKHLDEISGEHLPKQLGRGEVEANLLTFMGAGYETTSTFLTYASYVLVSHQDVQQKLFEEMFETYGTGSKKKTDTDNVKELVYLDYFIKETLRFYPIAATLRRCIKPTVIKGIDMQPGLIVRPDHRTLNFSETHWGSDAKEFNPMRHAEKRNPLLYLAFGLGPRNCVGMKFALAEMKLALVNLLLTFEFHPSKNTPVTLETVEGLVTQPQEFSVLFKKRKNASQE